MTLDQLKIDCEALAAAGDSRAKMTLELMAELDSTKKELAMYQSSMKSIAVIANQTASRLATVASVLPVSDKKDLITAAAKIEAGAKPEDIPELKGLDPKIFEANTDRPAGYRNEDSKRSGV